jgi:hypothetical protein
VREQEDLMMRIEKSRAWSWRCSALVLVGVLLGACGEQGGGERVAKHQSAKPIAWDRLAQQHIVFAHQSVGDNILDGVSTLEKRDKVTLPVTKSRTINGAGITHFDVGHNGDPLGKIEDFSATMSSVGNADVAILKLCFWDFNPENGDKVDSKKVAEAYVKTLDDLSARYPQTRFVAATVPLMTVQTGFRASLKKLLGKEPSGYADNARRADFNDIVRKHFQNSGRLLDIAQLESTGGGSVHAVSLDDRRIEVLDPALTDDGGHLNQQGKELIATELLQLVSAQGKAE